MSAMPDDLRRGLEDDPSDGAELFRQAFRRHAATVVVVTYIDGTGASCGMTATSMCSLSDTPPSLLLCVNKEARAHDEIAEAHWLGVNLLSIGQRPIALQCSRQGADKRLRPDWLMPDPTVDATPRLRGSLAHLECEVDTTYQAYSHTVFVALIRSVWLNPVDAPPLLYHGGLYSQLESPAEQAERFHWELREG
jgi:flavin reductase (DIM6/NTAB) family NADH-FMN oxidoreductase RutF